MLSYKIELMKHTLIIAGALLFTAGLPKVRGQSVAPSTLNSTGGTGPISGNIYDWSVGEMTMVSTFTGSTVIVTQGLLQADPASLDIVNTDLAKKLQVFPNPANSFVNIRFTSPINGRLSYKLMDLNGRIILDQSAEVKQNTTAEQVNVSDLAAATYMLEISFDSGNGKQETTSYKIQKLK